MEFATLDLPSRPMAVWHPVLDAEPDTSHANLLREKVLPIHRISVGPRNHLNAVLFSKGTDMKIMNW